jgi:hypothetical protein
MSTTTTQINTLSKGFTPARISLVSDATKNDPKWMTELRTKGWTVVPNALSKEKASSYADEGYKWLESWELGYDHKDESTRKTANLPWHIRGGLYAQ